MQLSSAATGSVGGSAVERPVDVEAGADAAADAGMASSPIAPSLGDTAAAAAGRFRNPQNGNAEADADADAAPNTLRTIAHRPVPQSQLGDPRAYQISQIRRRFSPVEEQEDDNNGSTILSFRMAPSDPDFPFEMDALQCRLSVPRDYPTGGGKPTLRVTNADMERGYQINVERGFDRIVAGARAVNLLRCFNALDRELEALLSGEKAETVKIVVNRGRGQGGRSSPSQQQKAEIPLPAPAGASATATAPPAAAPAPARIIVPEPVITSEAREQALQIRSAEVRQLESRLGKQPQFHKSADGLTFTLPIEVRKRQELPVELQAVKQVKLIVPEAYNIIPCRIELVGVGGPTAEAVATAFRDRAKAHPELTLMNHINYLSQNLHTMAKITPKKQEAVAVTVAEAPQASTAIPDTAGTQPKAELSAEQSDRPHVIRVPRPPEWDIVKGEDDEDSDTSSESSDEDHSEDDNDASEGEADSVPTQIKPPERGILISFPHLELYGIELLTISHLNITVKCDRCKDIKDITGLQSQSGTASQPRNESCKKCAAPWSAAFRGELMHMNSNRAGYVDLEGCTIVDMLLSSFFPTCSECSTAHPQPVKAVRGDSQIAFCRECHHKMTFRIPEIKFLRTGASGLPLKAASGRKKKTENLGIVAGRELPGRGRCSHYKKSYRWFRFSCCNKVFPCDRCHGESEDHAIEMANRMICGSCSREQNYRPKDCGICHAWLTVRPGKGFWHGGQGTRDQTKMSRKDPRKYKRIGTSKAKASS